MGRRHIKQTFRTLKAGTLAIGVLAFSAEQGKSAGKWDGEWVASTKNPAVKERVCMYFEISNPVVIEGGVMRFELNAVTEHQSRTISLADTEKTRQVKIDSSGKFEDWVRVNDSRGITNYKIFGQFKGNTFQGDYYGNFDVGRAAVACVGEFELARVGSFEAAALTAGKDAETVALMRDELQRMRREIDVSAGSNNSANDIQKDINRLKQLRHAGAITPEQFNERQAALLDKAFGTADPSVALRLAPKVRSDPIVSNITFGNYHALVIGINQYKHLKNLRTAIADARAVAKLLSDEYGFTVDLLLNPTRSQIIDTLDDLRASLTFKDNLLVYYAGHGWLDEGADRGFWLPSDAQRDRRSNWVSNATLTDTLKATQAKHVMVVADSCYSGRLTRDASVKLVGPEYYKKMSRKKARVVITSGGLEPVEDGIGKHSPFAKAFLKSLANNETVMDGTQLFTKLRQPVMVEADQTPQYSNIHKAGHEGGDFLFVRRN